MKDEIEVRFTITAEEYAACRKLCARRRIRFEDFARYGIMQNLEAADDLGAGYFLRMVQEATEETRQTGTHPLLEAHKARKIRARGWRLVG